ncbi:uncharacterized protein LOC132716717 [Ruditapes philippinarum]|uniref:uncharacterized protein LOC132716717 n=1 Tax=Ruditapes philippinarum TaxID=129788 RepID=UPI00295B0DCF|nr:uncharacterized protein LOC132716717 [Ruditapes philippinarum]
MILCRGLSFCPTPRKTDKIELQRDLLLFDRRMRLKHYFTDTTYNNPDPFTQSSGWKPPAGKSMNLDAFLSIVHHDILTIKQSPNTNYNITPDEYLAITKLQQNKDIIIKQADKGGAIVILNKSDYIVEGLRQLNDKITYRTTPYDLTNKSTREINNFLTYLKKHSLMSQQHISYLTAKNCRTPIFYLLPKIHKPNNPGRPIVSACGSPTEKLSEFVDHFLQPLARKVPSYIKDTRHFLEKIHKLNNVPKDAFLVTIDVTALYTNIPHKEGILAAKYALQQRSEQEPKTWILLRILYFILKKTCFRFNDTFYEQIAGTTMGTKCAPSYAIIFMDKIEQEFLAKYPISPLVWWRYIDDIFMVWPHSREDLNAFTTALNSFHTTVKFTVDINQTSANFLDVTVKDLKGKLSTTLYTKPTDAHMYLHYSSFHPRHQKASIPYSQAVRIRRICSTDEQFEICTKQLTENLIARGYPRKLIYEAIKKAKITDLDTNVDTKAQKEIIPLIITHNPLILRTNNIISKYTHLLENDPTLTMFNKYKICTVFRKPACLRNTLTKSDINPQMKPQGSHPCKRNCIACKHISSKSYVKIHSTGKYFHIKGTYDCNSSSLIYLITCNKCGIQYVGQTGNTIRERLYGHFADIKNANNYKPVSRHYTTHEHNVNDVDVTMLLSTPKNVNIRLRTEETLISIFKTRSPSGLNLIQ